MTGSNFCVRVPQIVVCRFVFPRIFDELLLEGIGLGNGLFEGLPGRADLAEISHGVPAKGHAVFV